MEFPACFTARPVLPLDEEQQLETIAAVQALASDEEQQKARRQQGDRGFLQCGAPKIANLVYNYNK